MFFLYKLLGSLCVPPGLFILLASLAAAVSLRKPRRPRKAACFFFCAFVLWFMSCSAGALCITGPLEERFERKLPPAGEKAAIVVLAGGSSYDAHGNSVQPGLYALERLFAAVQLAKELSGDTVLLFSGGNVFGSSSCSEAQVLREAATALGCRAPMLSEEKSRTTAENFIYTAELLRENSIKNAVIVTNAFHIPRSMKNAARFMPEISAFPWPSGRLTDPVIRGFSSFLPNASDFMTSAVGIKEWVGLAARALRP